MCCVTFIHLGAAINTISTQSVHIDRSITHTIEFDISFIPSSNEKISIFTATLFVCTHQESDNKTRVHICLRQILHRRTQTRKFYLYSIKMLHSQYNFRSLTISMHDAHVYSRRPNLNCNRKFKRCAAKFPISTAVACKRAAILLVATRQRISQRW